MATKKNDKKQIYFPKPDDLAEHWLEQVDEAENSREEWVNKRRKYSNMRRRIRKKKTFPFVGCANVKMPTIETAIRKLKANHVNGIFGIRPVVQAIPPASMAYNDMAMKVEKFCDHLIMDVDKAKIRSVRAIDQELEQGFVVLKPYWKYEETNRVETFKIEELTQQQAEFIYNPQITTEQLLQGLVQELEVDMSDKVAAENIEELQKVADKILDGEDNIKFTLCDVLKNHPSFEVYHADRVYVPADATADIEDLPWIAFEMFLPYDRLKQNAKVRGWDEAAIEDMDSMRTFKEDDINNYLANDIKKISDMDKEVVREGIMNLNNPSGLVRIMEFYAWTDIDGDGEVEKAYFCIAPDFKKVLRKPITLPFKNGKFPAIKLSNEETEDRWYSPRGIPELGEDLYKEIDVQHNAKLDSMTIRNAPMFSFKAGVVNPKMVKFIPAQAIPRQEADDVTMLNNTNTQADYSYDREQQILESKIEGLIGQVDYGLQAQVNRRQPRSATEVDAARSSQEIIYSLDSELQIEAFGQLFQWYLDLWCQYGNDAEEIAYFGQEGWEKIRLTREQIQGHRLVLRGNDRNTNPQVKMQTAQLILQDVYSALQTGSATPKEVYNARKRFYQALGETQPELYVKEPEPKKPELNPEIIKTIADKLTATELAQVKQLTGIQPDMQGAQIREGLDLSKKKADIDKVQSDIQSDMVNTLSDGISKISKDEIERIKNGKEEK